MESQICFRCFKIKGDYEVCPHCGYVEDTKAEQVYQLKPGTILRDRYIIGTSIGFGGFGITYRAFDTALGTVVAVKEFYPAGLVNRGDGETKVGVFSGEKEEEFKRQLRRFLEEARNMAMFSKERDIVNVFDYFEENQTAYIIMEYVDAPLLKTKLKEKGKFSSEEAVPYMKALLDALSKIHARGIIHKDISPDNIFLTGQESIKLFDFGAAKLQGAQSQDRTEAAVVKAGYTPPEQYRVNQEQGPYMDLYAAGAVFYEMLTGEKPIEAPDRAAEDILKKPSEFDASIGKHLERVILKALAMRPQYRFQSAKEMKAALEGKEEILLPEEELSKAKKKKRRKIAGMAAAVFIAAAAAAFGWRSFSDRGKLNPAGIQADEIEVWLMAEEEEGEAVKEILMDSVKEVCPQITLSVKTIPKERYAEEIKSAAEEERLPEVFCTDGGMAEEYCADLSPLLRSMKCSDYLYLDGLKEEKEVLTLPTAMQPGIVYISEEKESDPPESINIEELAEKKETTGFADNDTSYEKFENAEDPLSYIAGDLSAIERVKEVTVELLPPTDFKAVPVLKEDRLIGTFVHSYGVYKDAGSSKQEAGMVVLSQLLSDGVQSVSYMGNSEGIPLNRNVYGDYAETKLTTYLAFLKKYDPEEAELFPQDTMCAVLEHEMGGK